MASILLIGGIGLFLLALALGALFRVLRRECRPARRNSCLALLCLALALIAAGLLFGPFGRTIRSGVTVEIIDVGQGDAVLVQSGDRQVLIDGGPNRTVLTGLGRSLPIFDRQLDLVVLTHPHGDHADGLAQVFERYDAPELWLPLGAPATADGEAVERAAAAGEPTNIRRVRRGDSFALDENARLEVLWPLPDGASGDDDLNDYSVVLRLSLYCGAPDSAVKPSACRTFLLMGDATGRVERFLLEAGGGLAADVLKVGHHGSRQSTTGQFLDAVQPSAAAISVGRNSYGHPAPALLRRLESAGVQTWRTDLCGSIRFHVNVDTMTVESDRCRQ